MNSSKTDVFLWVLIPAAAAVAILEGLNFSDFFNMHGPSLLVTVCLIFAFIHANLRYGFKTVAFWLMITIIIGNIYENTSIATGFPFGNYHYTDQLGPKFIFTPVIINVAYFQLLYLSWTLAHVLIDNYSNALKGIMIFIQPLIATFVMVMWDMVIDPHMSTVHHHWIWEEGGAYWGVPLSNYLGWYLCVYTMYQIFALYIAKDKSLKTPDIMFTRKYWLQAASIYAAWPLMYLVKSVCVTNNAITALDNHVWHLKDMYQSSALVALSTMCFIVLLVVIKVLVLKHVPESENNI